MNESCSDIQEIKKQAGLLIKQMLNQQLSASECLKRWPANDSFPNKDLITAFHALQHFQSDEDIRESDAEYAQMQKEELSDIAERLIEDRPLSIAQTAFLEPKSLNLLHRVTRWFVRFHRKTS